MSSGFDVEPSEAERLKELSNYSLSMLLQRLKRGVRTVEAIEDRTLFVGNVLAAVNDTVLRDFLNAAMQQVELVKSGESPITSVRKNQKYAFIELTSAQEANKALNLYGIPFMGQNLVIKRPTNYKGPNTPAKTWNDLIGAEAGHVPPRADPATKCYREVFVGNIPQDCTVDYIRDFFNTILRRLGLASPRCLDDSVVTVRLSSKFCFVEFATVEETINVLNMSGIPMGGIALNIKPPSGANSKKGNADVLFFTWEHLLRKWMNGEGKLAVRGSPTQIICISTSLKLLDNSEELPGDFVEDTLEECSDSGRVVSVQVKAYDSHAGYHSRVFVEMETVEEAKAVLCALIGRKYQGGNGMFVDIRFYPRSDFDEHKFDSHLSEKAVCASSPSHDICTSAQEYMA